jgi:hypothetical protein
MKSVERDPYRQDDPDKVRMEGHSESAEQFPGLADEKIIVFKNAKNEQVVDQTKDEE